MKKLIVLFFTLFILIGCAEDERTVCIECITTSTGGIYEQASTTTVTCGNYTPKEIEQNTRTVITWWYNEVGDTITHTTKCKVIE